MKRGSKLMMTWVTIVPEHEVSDAPEIFYPLPLGETSTEKKRFLSGISRITSTPWPQFGQLGPLFLRQKRRFACMTGKKFDADNEGCNDNYDDNYGNFDDNYDKND